MTACFKNQIFAEPKMKFMLSLLFLLALILLIQAMPRYILVPINKATPIYIDMTARSAWQLNVLTSANNGQEL